MATNPITTPLPADLPVNWAFNQIVAPNGSDVGMAEQYGYNYLMQQVNAAQHGVNSLGNAFPELVPWALASNENLLINWYFLDPINQRGQAEYSSGGYTIDRWRIGYEDTLAVNSDGILMKESSSTRQVTLNQLVPINPSWAGLTVTFSVLTKEEIAAWTGLGLEDTYGRTGTGKLHTYTRTLPSQLTTDRLTAIINGPALNAGYHIIAAKLELGDRQTLAHQDGNGNWVLNDPPPDKALELVKCQRYYQKNWTGTSISNTNRPANRFAKAAMTTYRLEPVELHIEMRMAPTIKIYSVNGEKGHVTNWANPSADNDITNCTADFVSNKGFTISNESNAFTAGAFYCFYHELDAELY